MNVVFTQVSETMDTILIKEAFTVPRIREEKLIVRLHTTQCSWRTMYWLTCFEYVLTLICRLAGNPSDLGYQDHCHTKKKVKRCCCISFCYRIQYMYMHKSKRKELYSPSMNHLLVFLSS